MQCDEFERVKRSDELKMMADYRQSAPQQVLRQSEQLLWDQAHRLTNQTLFILCTSYSQTQIHAARHLRVKPKRKLSDEKVKN